MKNKKLLTIAAIMASAMLFLSGCVQHTASGKPYGFVYDNLAVPTQHVLVWLSQILGNSLGWAIIVITFIVRLVLMPIMIKQSKNATVQQEKIAHIKPLMEDITKRQKEATSDAERMAINQEMMQLYRDNNISMTGGIGCLPLLIQMPIFAALYAAIQYSPELSRSPTSSNASNDDHQPTDDHIHDLHLPCWFGTLLLCWGDLCMYPNFDHQLYASPH